MRDNNQLNRRGFLRLSAGTLVALAAVSPAMLFLPKRKPERLSNDAVPTGMAADIIINMALLDMITKDFRLELKKFKFPDGRQIAHFNQACTLVTVECGNKITRTFRRVNVAIDANNSGGKAIAFEEVELNGANFNAVNSQDLRVMRDMPIRVLCPGLSPSNDALGASDGQAVHDILEGKRSPQIPFIQNYVRSMLIPYLRTRAEERGEAVCVELFGHSLGCPNALQAKYLLSSHPDIGYYRATLFEPIAAVDEAHCILCDVKPLDLESFVVELARNVRVIRAFPSTAAAELYPGNVVSNKPFCDAYFIIDHGYFGDTSLRGREEGMAGEAAITSAAVGAMAVARLIRHHTDASKSSEVEVEQLEAEMIQPLLSRRNLVKRGAIAVIGTLAVVAFDSLATYAGGKWTSAKDIIYHDLPVNARALAAKGDAALTPCRIEGVVPSLEQLTNPQKSPAPFLERPIRVLEQQVGERLYPEKKPTGRVP